MSNNSNSFLESFMNQGNSKVHSRKIVDELDKSLQTLSSFDEEDFEMSSGIELHSIEDREKIRRIASKFNIMKDKNLSDKFTYPLGHITSSGFPYVKYDYEDPNILRMEFSSSLLNVRNDSIIVRYCDVIFIACCLLKPSYNLVKKVDEFLGLSDGFMKTHDKEGIVFPSELIINTLSKLDFVADITFGIKLFTVLYNSIEDRYVSPDDKGLKVEFNGMYLLLDNIKVKTNAVTREIRNANRNSKYKIKDSDALKLGIEDFNNRASMSIIDDVVSGASMELYATKLSEWFVRDSNYWEFNNKINPTYGYRTLPTVFGYIDNIEKFRNKGNEVSKTVFENPVDVDAVSAACAKSLVPKEVTLQAARLSVIENYVLGIMGRIVVTDKEDSNYVKLAERVGQTTANNYTDREAYIDYLYAVSLGRLASESNKTILSYRLSLVTLMDNLFNRASMNYSEEDYNLLVKSKEDAVSSKQSIINRLQDKVDKLSLQVEELSKDIIKEDTVEELDLVERGTVTKNMDELSVCVVADFNSTKNIELISPLFGSLEYVSKDDSLRHDYRKYDYVILRTDIMGHDTLYKIKSDNKNILYVKNADSRRWIQNIVLQLQ